MLQQTAFFLICASLLSRYGNVNRNVNPFNTENLKFLTEYAARDVDIKHLTF